MKKLLINKREFTLIVLGATILALGITWFLSPSNLVTGGISGLSIVIYEVSKKYIGFGIPLWLTTFSLNVPLFFISIKQRGFNFAKRSLYSVIMLSFSLWYTQFIPNPFNVKGDLLLSGIFGGVFLGVGIGIILRVPATTGGTDMIAAIIKFKFPAFPITKLMLFIDGLIIFSGFFIFGAPRAMYAIISVYITSKVIGNILEGVNYAKVAFIVSPKNEEISKQIIENIPRGVTKLSAQGMYSGDEKDMLFVVVSQKQITVFREIIRNVDENAFVAIADVKEVLGKGFIEDFDSLAL